MSEFKIEKNVPVPVSYTKNNLKYPFDQMEVGDSFFIPFKEGQSNEEKRKITNAVSSSCFTYKRAKKLNDITFATRMTKEGVRCWRTN